MVGLAPPYPVVTSYTFGNGLAAVANAVSWVPNTLTTKGTPIGADTVAGYDSVGAVIAKFTLSSLPVSTPAAAAILAARSTYVGLQALSGARTLVLADAGKLLAAAAVNSPITIPPNSAVAYPLGTQIDFVREAAGTVSFVAGAGVTFVIVAGATQIAAAGLGASIVYLGGDVWWIVGALAP